MKIICIGYNYRPHIEELKAQTPTVPVFFTKPDSAFLKKGQPFYYPDFTKELHYEAEVVVKINKVGKNISKKFANRYYNEIGFGIDFTARDLQNQCIAEGKPWEIAKAFDGAAPVGDFYNVSELGNIEDITIKLEKNGEVVQHDSLKSLIFSIDDIIAYVSQFMTLKIGDLIYTGTPCGVGEVKIGDKLTGYINNKQALELLVR